MVVGKRRGAICGRGRQRKRTPFAGRNVGLHEPVTLVLRRLARGAHVQQKWIFREFRSGTDYMAATGSWLFPVEKKCDVSVRVVSCGRCPMSHVRCVRWRCGVCSERIRNMGCAALPNVSGAWTEMDLALLCLDPVTKLFRHVFIGCDTEPRSVLSSARPRVRVVEIADTDLRYSRE